MRLEFERDVDFLARADAVVDSFAVLKPPAPTLIERKRGVNEIAMLLQKPRYAVVVAGFFVRRERDDDVALRNPTLTLVANQIGDADRRHRLVIARRRSSLGHDSSEQEQQSAEAAHKSRVYNKLDCQKSGICLALSRRGR